MSVDPLSGLRTYHEYNHLTKETTITTQSPKVDPILNRNVVEFNDDDAKKKGIKNGWWHVASIDAQTILNWRAEGIDLFNKNDQKKILKKLQDRDFRKLRTSPGRLI